jgi:hypothetical protein
LLKCAGNGFFWGYAWQLFRIISLFVNKLAKTDEKSLGGQEKSSQFTQRAEKISIFHQTFAKNKKSVAFS